MLYCPAVIHCCPGNLLGIENLRILILSVLYPKTYNNISGVFAHQQIKHIVEHGIDVRVVTGIPWAPKPLWYNPKWRAYGQSPCKRIVDNVQVFYPRYIELPGRLNFSWSGIALYLSIRKLVRNMYNEFPFDIIHANTIVPDGFAGVRLAREFKVPCICVSRGDLNIYPYYGPSSMKVTQNVLRKCDKLVTVSKDLSKVAVRLEPNTPKDISVVYNGCDLESFHPVEHQEKILLRAKLGLPKEKIILFLLGALEENKGVFELLDVYVELKRRWNDEIYLLMIGRGKDEKTFLSRIDELQLKDSIHLTGFVPHDEVPDWVKTGDIMIFPTHYEGVPNAVLETMACAKPVVATAVGGIPEIINDGETGFLVKKKDVKGIVKVVNHLIKDEDLRKRIGNSALEFLRNHASWPGNAKKMIKIYHDVINAYKNKLSDADERRLSGF